VTIKVGEVAKVAFVAENRGTTATTGKAASTVREAVAGCIEVDF